MNRFQYQGDVSIYVFVQHHFIVLLLRISSWDWLIFNFSFFLFLMLVIFSTYHIMQLEVWYRFFKPFPGNDYDPFSLDFRSDDILL
jgi:hypothetical protein